MLANPIFHKEVITSLRTNRAVLLQWLFIGILSLLTLLLWPPEGISSKAAQSARSLFTVLAIGQLCLVTLFSPAFASTALTLEKEKNTWDMLYATLLEPFHIVSGKMLGALSFQILLICTSIPFAAMCYLLGGVSVGDLLAMYGVLLLTALCFALLGLTVSAACRRSYSAVITTYGIIIIVCGFVLLPAQLLSKTVPAETARWLEAIRCISPFWAMTQIVQPNFTRASGELIQHLGSPVRLFVYITAVASIVMAFRLAWYLRTAPQPRPRPTRKATQDRGTGQRVLRRFFFLIDPDRRKRMIGNFANPVLIKDFRSRRFGKAHWIARGFCFCLVVAILLGLIAAQSVGTQGKGVQHIANLIVIFQMLIVVLIGPALAANAISGEREANVFDMLRTTRLSAASIIWGKLMAALLPMILMLLATLPTLGFLCWIDPAYLQRLLRVLIVLGLAVLFTTSVGLMFSTIMERTAAATVAAYAVVVAVVVGTMLAMLGQGTIFSNEWVAGIYIFNPILTALEAIGLDKLEGMNLFEIHWKIFVVVTGICLLIAIVRVARLVAPTDE